jgi:uncharacterized FlaG/YvyC family protein
MQLPPIRPADDVRPPREPDGRAQPTAAMAPRTDSSRPDAGGVTAGQNVSGGSLRDAAEGRQTKDQLAAADDAARSKLAATARRPGQTRVSIEVDAATNETRFLVIDRVTGEVVRRIPEDEARQMLKDASEGAFVDRLG